tara:strand:- start:103 stop:672 length:570 start_codon:yes stop_codon:yes gene_type:complete
MERDTFEPCHGIAALPPDRALLSAILLSLGMVDRSKLETFIQTAIAVIDELDGDPEAEPEPDEANGDEFDASAPEWYTLGKGKRNWRAANHSITMSELMCEDTEIDDCAEDDDPAGQCSEDEISCGPGHWGGHYQRETGPGCAISDPCGGEPEHGCPDRYHGDNQTLIFSHRRHHSGGQSVDQWPNSST